MKIFRKQQRFNYRIDTFKNVNQMDLENCINNIASEKLFKGRWKLHSVNILQSNGHTYNALVIHEREIEQ